MHWVGSYVIHPIFRLLLRLLREHLTRCDTQELSAVLRRGKSAAWADLHDEVPLVMRREAHGRTWPHIFPMFQCHLDLVGCDVSLVRWTAAKNPDSQDIAGDVEVLFAGTPMEKFGHP